MQCYAAGSEQHAFVLQDLKSVNRSLTPWLVVGGHRPFYIDSTNNMEPDGDQPVATALREAFEDAFYDYQVRTQMFACTATTNLSMQLSGGHRPFYIDCTNNMEPDGNQPVASALREAFVDVFYNHQVGQAEMVHEST